MPYKDPQKAREYAREYAQKHKEEMRERLYIWRKNNPEKSKAIYKKYSKSEKGKAKSRKWAKKSRLLNYGITEDILEDMKKKQNDKCAICGKIISEFTKDFAVDHNHINGKVRGLLCMNCNAGLGNFKDSNTILQKAIDYLNS